MASLANLIKQQIKTDLDALVSSGILGSVTEQDLSKDALENDYPAYPAAILGMAQTESRYEESRANLRTYTFPIMVLQKWEETITPEDTEELVDTILNKFDDDFDLQGMSVGGLEATVTPAAPASTVDKTYVYFLVIIKAKALYQLSN